MIELHTVWSSARPSTGFAPAHAGVSPKTQTFSKLDKGIQVW